MDKEARLEILKGNDAGARFRITGDRVIFGRSSDCDIVVTDPSASRNHAELVKVEDDYILRDLKSSNGIFVNNKKVAEHRLVSGDIFTIGTHAYRYIIVETRDVKAPPSPPPKEGPIPGISAPSLEGEIRVPGASSDKARKRRFILYGGVLLVLAVFLLLMTGEDTKEEKEAAAPPTEEAEESEESIDSFLGEDVTFKRKISPDMREFFSKANEFYFTGKREFRLGNYSRALEEFRKALTFYPKHAKSRIYAKITAERIRERSLEHMRIGKKLISQFKYESAIKHFREVMSLNVRKPGSKLFKEAEKMKAIAEKRRGMVFQE